MAIMLYLYASKSESNEKVIRAWLGMAHHVRCSDTPFGMLTENGDYVKRNTEFR